MDLTYSPADQAFRAEVRGWLEEQERVAWNRLLAEHGWTCLGWPTEHGGRGLSLVQQVIFHEEYARTDAPGRVNHLGEELLGPTLIAFGTPEQQQRFLPRIVAVEELWAQGYSEPDAGSDLANVQTKARLVGDEWVIDGQKVWTSNAHLSQWAFVICRTEPGSERHHGLSFLLVPREQDGVEIRPIEQLTGGSEFNEVFFTGARTAADLVVGDPGGGWRVAMALLGFERELDAVVAVARSRGLLDDPVVRDRLVEAWVGLRLLRYNALRTM
ncbi:MAG: acyl-CoA dehydrogenase family protein, partial [Nocardioides sp.]|nr:acyl-CoA dehydrogenase family protein [Nocardioides sp.]